METVICPICGSPQATMINENEFRCTYCNHVFGLERPVISEEQSSQGFQNGAYQEQAFYNEPPLNEVQGCTKNKTTAGLLALFVGGLGAHQFYLGHMVKGILYLVLCWTYIPGIIGFIEAIMLLSQSEEDFVRKPRLII